MNQKHFTVRIQNPDKILKEIAENKRFIHFAERAEDIFMKPFEISEPEEYEKWKHKKFPKCCNFHKTVELQTKKWQEKFPNCCDEHKKIAREWYYKKVNYENVSNKILKQLSYTEYHIIKHINDENWYKKITDYIEYNIDSFGQPHIGFSHYIIYLKHYINTPAKRHPLYKEKKKQERLIEYIESLSLKEEDGKTDLNILLHTYQKWVKTLPIELEIFQDIKKELNETLPIFKSKVFNPYTGLSKYRVRTRTELIEFLVDATKKLLNKIDLPQLVQNGDISNIDKMNIEIINKEYKLKNEEILTKSIKEEKHYRRVIKKWLAFGKDYLKEIKPYLNKIQQENTKNIPTQNNTKTITQRQVALKYRYLVLANEHLPISVENRNSIAAKYGYTAPTSGQKIYDWFNKLNTTNQRTAKGKVAVKDLQKVISILENSKAKSIAEDELKIAKTKN